jgi:hypothetical protein
MPIEQAIAGIESEWEAEAGFFWKIRQGAFTRSDCDRALAKIAALPSASGQPMPLRLVSVLWYIPLFMHWQLERVRERGGKTSEYMTAMNELTAEVERILGVP